MNQTEPNRPYKLTADDLNQLRQILLLAESGLQPRQILDFLKI